MTTIRNRAKHAHVKANKMPFANGDPLTLGQLLQNYREEKGISLSKLASRLEISLSMASLVERDRAFPGRPILEKIAGILNRSHSELAKLDTRLRIDHLRRIIEKSAPLSEALRLMVDEIRDGQASPERFAKAIVDVSTKR